MTDFALARPITLADAAAAAGLIRAAFGGIRPPLAPPPSALGETEESVLAQIAGGGAVVWRHAVLVGVVLWERRAPALYLKRLAVDGTMRGQGVATSLLRAGEAAARGMGLARLDVGVRLVLVGNRRLFAGQGFTEGAVHAHPGFDAPTWVEMHKALS